MWPLKKTLGASDQVLIKDLTKKIPVDNNAGRDPEYTVKLLFYERMAERFCLSYRNAVVALCSEFTTITAVNFPCGEY